MLKPKSLYLSEKFASIIITIEYCNVIMRTNKPNNTIQMTIDNRQNAIYNNFEINERRYNMKTCQTCGKVLKDSMEEFRVNGILQCESCAYSKDPIIKDFVKENNANQKESNNVSSVWIGSLKTIAKINMIVGIIASIIVGVFVYNVVYSDYAILFAFTAFAIGVVLSLMSNSLLMVFAEMAEDISIMRYLMNKE